MGKKEPEIKIPAWMWGPFLRLLVGTGITEEERQQMTDWAIKKQTAMDARRIYKEKLKSEKKKEDTSCNTN